MLRRRRCLPALALGLAGLTGCTSAAPANGPSNQPATAAPPRSTSAPAAGSALSAVARLAVKGRAPLTGYSRAQFGPVWTDDNDDPLGHNGCDTRNDILRRDLTDETLKPGTRDCLVLTGTLNDPYTSVRIAFTRGVRTSAEVQIDHIVALGDAWQTGAQQWTDRKRRNLANDPLELLAVDGPSNEAKGDSDAASWLPPKKAFRCAYVARQVAVKARYGLAVTAAERAAMTRVLTTCPAHPLPSETGSPAS